MVVASNFLMVGASLSGSCSGAPVGRSSGPTARMRWGDCKCTELYFLYNLLFIHGDFKTNVVGLDVEYSELKFAYGPQMAP